MLATSIPNPIFRFTPHSGLLSDSHCAPDREDENLKGAQKHHDPIPNVEMTKPSGITPQRGQPGESAAGGFEEGPVNSRTPGDDDKKR